MGYVLYSKEYLNIPMNFGYIFVLSSIGCLVFLAGLMKLLLPTTYFLFFGGLGLFSHFMLKGKWKNILTVRSITLLNVAFIVGVIVVFSSLITTRFVHYDNFSHWAIAVRYLLNTNAFPDANATLVDFINYPLGTTSFIYYVCKIAGGSQGMMLVAQAMLIFGCFYAMFGVIREKKRLLLYNLLGFGYGLMTVFNIAIRINNLLVDFVLPLMALAAIAVIYGNKGNIKKACLISCPIMGFLMIVKNTGIIFAAFVMIYLFYVAFNTPTFCQELTKIKRGVFCIGVMILSALPLVGWQLHIANEFGDVSAKFDMSKEQIATIYGEKSPEQIGEIITLFKDTVFDVGTLSTAGVAIFNLFVISAFLFVLIVLKKKWKILRVLVITDIVVVLYYLGMLAMYIFSMPLDEAIRLAGFERYASSIILFMIGCLLFSLVINIQESFYIQLGDTYDYKGFRSIKTKQIYQYAATTLFIFATILFLSEINGMNVIKDQYEASLPGKIEKLVGDTGHYTDVDNKKYLFYASDTDEQVSSNYLQYVAKYMLYAPYVDAVAYLDENDFIETIKDYDYFVILESDPSISKLMKKYLGLNGDEGIYEVGHILQGHVSR